MVCVVDLHALTSLKNPQELHQNILGAVKDFVGAGLDPKKTVLFQQSQVQEHTELAWIFECLVTVPFLMQSHAYKDKVAKGIEATAGLFNYPMLMAADILLYDTDIVPVGADQRQHVEFAREAAAKFNNAFGATFKEPKEFIQESVALIPGTDGKKMSKSYGNTIQLFGTKDEIAKAVMSIVTDSSGERPENVYAIHTFFRNADELGILYEQHKGKYKALKDALIEDIEGVIAPMRERRAAVSDADAVQILNEGSARARERAQAKMKEVRAKVGLSL
jgi:tryptophanyl-tRNA synthetase